MILPEEQAGSLLNGSGKASCSIHHHRQRSWPANQQDGAARHGRWGKPGLPSTCAGGRGPGPRRVCWSWPPEGPATLSGCDEAAGPPKPEISTMWSSRKPRSEFWVLERPLVTRTSQAHLARAERDDMAPELLLDPIRVQHELRANVGCRLRPSGRQGRGRLGWRPLGASPWAAASCLPRSRFIYVRPVLLTPQDRTPPCVPESQPLWQAPSSELVHALCRDLAPRAACAREVGRGWTGRTSSALRLRLWEAAGPAAQRWLSVRSHAGGPSLGPFSGLRVGGVPSGRWQILSPAWGPLPARTAGRRLDRRSGAELGRRPAAELGLGV